MSEILRKLFQDKNVLILGFGREGQTTYNTLRQFFPGMPLVISDRDIMLTTKHPFLRSDSKLSLQLGPTYLDHLQDFDLIIKSPGVSPQQFPFTPSPELMTSQTELFIKAFRDQVIGVTGTKGKSTTATLIQHLLKGHFSDVLLAGNIGTPPFGMMDSISPDTIIVYEMSSHQLEQTQVSPHIAVMLNIFQEHLDHYPSYEAYQDAKMNICRYQKPGDWLIYIDDNALLSELISRDKPSTSLIPVCLEEKTGQGCWIKDGTIFFSKQGDAVKVMEITAEFPLKGEHNLLNILASVAVCKILGVPDPAISKGLYDFHTLEHRIEWIGNYNGIEFYNDSIATIPEASLAAIKALQEVDTLILGGMDRGIDYSLLAEELPGSAIRNIIFVGKAGERIHELLLKSGDYRQNLFTASNYEEVVRLAMKHTAKGKICLLSPAAASYDWFRNFEERGSIFKKLVKEYSS